MSATPEDITTCPRRVVLDATVLSNFAMAGQIQLLRRLYRGRACTTIMVVTEIQRGIDAGYRKLESVEGILLSLQPTGWLPVLALESAEAQALYLQLSASLGSGEASCLAVAVTRGLVLATDDLAARRRATQRGVRLTGTIGILVRLAREGHLPLNEANRILTQMIALRYRSPVASLDDLI